MENLRDLSKLHWTAHAGSPQSAENGATEGESVDEKGYVSTDPEAEARRDMSARRRERKKRRHKAEIFVGFLFLLTTRHWLKCPLDYSPYFFSYLPADIYSEASSCHDDVRWSDAPSSSPDTEHSACPRDLVVMPVPPGCDVNSV
jgi:hypothetical protein